MRAPAILPLCVLLLTVGGTSCVSADDRRPSGTNPVEDQIYRLAALAPVTTRAVAEILSVTGASALRPLDATGAHEVAPPPPLYRSVTIRVATARDYTVACVPASPLTVLRARLTDSLGAPEIVVMHAKQAKRLMLTYKTRTAIVVLFVDDSANDALHVTFDAFEVHSP